MNDLRQVTIEDIAADPHRYGVPTLEEFARNKSRWKFRPDVLGIIDGGPRQFRRSLKRIRYFIHGHEMDSLEMATARLSDEGYCEDDLELGSPTSKLKHTMDYVDVGGGLDHDLHINFLP